MPIKINYLNKTITETSENLVLFLNDKFNTNSASKYLTSTELTYINDLLKTSDLKKSFSI